MLVIVELMNEEQRINLILGSKLRSNTFHHLLTFHELQWYTVEGIRVGIQGHVSVIRNEAGGVIVGVESII